MIRQEDTRGVDQDQLRDDRTFDYIDRSNARPPLPPKQFRVQKAQNGIRFFAADRSRIAPEDGRLSSSVRYRVRWAEQLDASDTDKIEAAFVRSTIIATIEGTGKEGVEASAYVVDPMYSSGYYFCTGVDGNGEEGTEYSTPVQVTNQILDDSIPGDVTHIQVSESGTAHNDVVYSEISVSCRAPNPLTSFAGVQLFFRNYQELNAEQEGYFHPYNGAAGGSINFKVTYPVCRRKGLQTISATNASTAVTGSGFLTAARAGDLIEILGTRGTIQSVNSDTSITLTANWTGKTVVTFTDYNFIGKVDVYLVSISRGGTHRFDWRNSPNASVLFDGDLSAPNAPSIAATAQGNDVRIDLTPVIGTKIDRYIIYRGKGAGVAFSACSPIKPIPADTNNNTGLLQWVDTNFETFDREQSQVWSYYATAVNVGDQESAASARVEAACRLDSPGDGSPTIPAGSNPKNLLWDSHIYGTVLSTVGDANAFHQDDYMGGTVGVAGPPDTRGWHRWTTANAGAGSTPAGHQNTTEVILPAPTTSGGWVQLAQRIDAWDHATAANKRIDKGRNLMFACYLRSSSPTPPNGSITIHLAMMNGGADVGYYAVRSRIAGDTFDYTEVIRGGPTLGHTFAGSILTQNMQLLYVNFSPQTIPATVDQIEARITHWDTTNGNNLLITKAMLCYGDQLAAWTPELVGAIFPPPTGGAPYPGPFVDRDGSRRDRIDTP